MGKIMEMRDALALYRGKRLFVTGHTGFKGTWLVSLLHELGADVMGYALPPVTQPSHFALLGLGDRIQHVEGDIRDLESLSAAMRDFQPEIVIHMAAQALVKSAYADPVATFDVNVMGSVNVLESVRSVDSVRALVYITSDKCYENVEWVWGYRENDLIGGRDPYSASKGAAEVVFSSYQRSFFVQKTQFGAASVRAGNVIGGGDWAADRIIPDCIRAIGQGVPIVLRNPESTRPWQHVLEPLSGYLLLGASLYTAPQRFVGSWNFGPATDEVRNVRQVAEAVVRTLGRGEIRVDRPRQAHHEANLLQLNCDKARQLLRWSPRWGVDKALSATAEWYRVFLDDGDIPAMTRRQLHDYFPELR